MSSTTGRNAFTKTNANQVNEIYTSIISELPTLESTVKAESEKVMIKPKKIRETDRFHFLFTKDISFWQLFIIKII